MKNMMKIWVLISVSSLFAFSCQKNEVALENEQPSEKIIRTITFEYPENADTKVSLDSEGKTAWQAGDEILIHGQKMGHSGEEYYSRVVTLNADDIHNEGKTATLSFEDIIADKSWGRTGYKATMFAAYPASAVKGVSDGTSWYYSTGFDNTQSLLLGGCNDTSVNDGNTFRFVNLTGVISFVVSGDFDSFVFSGKNGDEVIDYDIFAVRIDTESSFGDKNAIPYSGGSGIKTSGEKTTISGPVVADGSTVNYIYLPGGANLSNGFIIRFLKGGDEIKRVSTETAKDVALGKYLKLGDITSHLHTYTPSWIASATNLGESESANSYVISAAGGYKIPTVKGNSSTSVGAVAGVELLWETYNNDQSVTQNSVISEVFFKTGEPGFVYFKTPATLKPGNALIAAKDASGDILWSWHIWIPEDEIETFGKYNVSQKYLMDRNLGALTAAAGDNGKNYGLLYQWGRPHPKVGLDGTGFAAGTIKYAKTYPSSAISSINTADGEKTILDAIQNPTVFFTNNHCWYDDSAVAEELWSTTKTIYDPCPAGWIVPAHGIINSSSAVEDVTNGGVNISGLYFPGTGSLSRYGGSWQEGNCFVWSSETYPSSNKQRAYWYLFKDYESAGFGVKEYKTTTAPVRCVKIVGEVPEPLPSGATSVVLDGDMSDWATADAISNSGSIKEWKYGSDAENLYFYFKITKSDIKDQDGSYNWRRYIFIAIDTDNDTSTGITFTDAGLSFPGCDAAAALYPFRGTVPDGQTYPAGVEFVNGEDLQGWTKSPADGGETGSKVTAFGYISGDYAYIEIGIPRSGLGSPVAGTMKVQFSYSYNLTGDKLISVN